MVPDRVQAGPLHASQPISELAHEGAAGEEGVVLTIVGIVMDAIHEMAAAMTFPVVLPVAPPVVLPADEEETEEEAAIAVTIAATAVVTINIPMDTAHVVVPPVDRHLT